MRHCFVRKLALPILFGLVASASPVPTFAANPMETFVSIVQLIATPQAFDQKRVIMIGYVRLAFEGQAIYLNETDAKHSITRNGLWLDVSEEIYANRARFHQRYVLVEGMFNARSRGHMGMFSGTIGNIGRFEVVD